MTTIPKTRYAKSGDVNIAYQVTGEGPLDLVFVPGFISNVEQAWEAPLLARAFERLASFSRLILFDKRGTGLSDPVTGVPTLEQRMDDVRAVMDAAGSERAALYGISEGGPMALLFAATYPDRTDALVLYGTTPRFKWAEDWPSGMTPDFTKMFFDAVEEGWGEGALFDLFAPSQAGSEQARQWWASYQRASASPGMAAAVIRMVTDIDVRPILPAITVPTLILHRRDELVVSVEGARYMAEHIPGAKYVELPGEDHIPVFGDAGAIQDEIEEFLTGARTSPEPDRVLATVLFTDIVGSTERAAELGDRRWRELLERHDELARRELDRHRGRLVKSMGDGLLATFDGPARGIRCAATVTEAMRELGLELRSGLHTGECELMGDDLGGIAVHTGARVAAGAGPGEVLVSGTVKDLVAGSGIEFDDRGVHALKGVPGEWHLYSVRNP